MFNEAFWFMYWVSVADSISTIFGIVGAILVIASIFACGCWLCDDDENAKRPTIVFGAIAGLLISISIATPPTAAFYAGAGQYIAESAELDDTLINLKVLLDAKIEELTE